VLQLGKVDNKTLLDVGAGSLAVIAAREFGCEVTTIDVSSSALKSARHEAAQTGLSKHIKCEQEDAADLSYPDNSFDVAVSYGALHHTPKIKRTRFLQELFRVARERIIIAEYRAAEFEQVHPSGDYEAVDLQELEHYLTQMGKTERHEGQQMEVFICQCRE